MSNDLTTNDDFDAYARQFGWLYGANDSMGGSAPSSPRTGQAEWLSCLDGELLG